MLEKLSQIHGLESEVESLIVENRHLVARNQDLQKSLSRILIAYEEFDGILCNENYYDGE